ncbi:hypothetical protein CFC21_057901, partial [Triticum aestivum]
MGVLVHVGVDPTGAGMVASCHADLVAWPVYAGEVRRGRIQVSWAHWCARELQGRSSWPDAGVWWRGKLLKRRGGAAGGSR